MELIQDLVAFADLSVTDVEPWLCISTAFVAWGSALCIAFH